MSEFTLIEPEGVHRVAAVWDDESVRIEPDALEQALGWTLKPEGLCREEVCVPVRDRETLASKDGIDLAAFADAIGRPLALDLPEGAAALGTPSSERAEALAGVEAPDFTLPDLQGKLHSLSDHRGKKVLLIAYASW